MGRITNVLTNLSIRTLTILSVGLLIAVFATIGMSFTPVEEEEIIVEQNDTIGTTTQMVIRKSHWVETGSCGGTTNKNNTDYAKTQAITKGHGKVSITNTTNNGSLKTKTTKTSTSNEGSAATIEWDCANSNDGHTNTFKFIATPDDGYFFAGWSKSGEFNDMTYTEDNLLCEVTIPGNNVGNQLTDHEDKNNRYTTTYYAYFGLITYVDVNFASVPTNCSYKITIDDSDVTETITTNNVSKTSIYRVILSEPTAGTGYVFAGWYQIDGSGRVADLSSAETRTAYFSENVTIGARFVSVTNPKFKNITTDTEYYGLKAATLAASSGETIIPVTDCTVDGSDLISGSGISDSYTIPSGVTLLVPHSSANTVLTKPAISAEAPFNIYRRLTITDGVNISVNGTICVGGSQVCAGGGNPSGYATGAIGLIDMSHGGHIELNNGSTLYVWGFIKGQDMDQGNNIVGVGTITANTGSTVWEDFAVGDWRGGSACLSIAGTNFFPFQSYFIQNIEVPLTIRYGATDKCYAAVNASKTNYQLPATAIGKTEALFQLIDESSVVRKWYDPTTDLTCFELSGTSNLDAVVVKGLPVIGNVSSADYYLPISSNMHVILTNSKVTLSKPMVMQPGAKVEVKKDATITIATNIYMYDNDDWGPYAGYNSSTKKGYYFHSYGKTYGILSSHKNRGDGYSKDLLDDAQIIVDGKLTIGSSGKIYSTAGGADIMGNGDGSAIFSGTLVNKATTIVAFTGNGDKVDGGVTVNQANLHNEDGSYTKSIASTTFKNVNGRWFVSSASSEQDNHTYDFTYISEGAVSGIGGTNTQTSAVYGQDKTGLEAGMKWCNVSQDNACSNIFNATQKLHDTEASDIRYVYDSEWIQLLKTETANIYGGSDNNLYTVDNCTVSSIGSTDENCLYTIGGVKKALVDGRFVAIEQNSDDEAWHNKANTEEYYITFAGCTWSPAQKFPNEEKAYIVDDNTYIWYNGDWKAVERDEPFFFDYNEQNVAVYYEYENREWVLATPRVRVTSGSEIRNLFFLAPAFDIVKTKKTATITLLKDIVDTTTPLSYTAASSTCTLDLNGHTASLTVTGSGTAEVKMVDINGASSTFTITDNSASKSGKLELIASPTTATQSKRWNGIYLTNGNLVLNNGTIKVIDNFTHTSNSNTGMVNGITIAAGKSFVMNDGIVDTESSYYPRSIQVLGSASANATVTINKGTINATSTQETTAHGIYAVGGTTTIKEGVTINATTTKTSSYGIYLDASTNGYFGTLNMTGGTINATATTTTALGIFVNGVYTFNATTPNTIKATYRAVATITGGTFNVQTLGTTTAYGIQSRGTTTVTNTTFNVTSKTSTSYGLLIQDGTTTINSGTVFNVKATATARGIYANGAMPDDKTGRPYNPNVIVNGGVFNVTATSTTPAHGIYMDCNFRPITNTASGYYAGVYSSVPTVTVIGGTFTVKSQTKEAWGIYVGRAVRYVNNAAGGEVEEYARSVANVKGGVFNVSTETGATAEGIRSYGNVNIEGSPVFEITPKTTTAVGLKVYDGTTTVNGTPTFTVKGTSTTYGAWVLGDTPNNKTGLSTNGELIINGGKFEVESTSTTTAYGVCVHAKGQLITNTASGYFPGTYSSIGKATINGGEFNVKSTTTSAYGIYVGRSDAINDPETGKFATRYFADVKVTGGKFTVVGTTTKSSTPTTDGIRSYGNLNVSGGEFNVTAGQSYCAGVRVYDGTAKVSGDTKFTVRATTYAYGAVVAGEAPNANTGLTTNADLTIDNGTFDVATTTSTYAYGALVSPAAPVAMTDDPANFYKSPSSLTINDGQFTVTAQTTTAQGVNCSRGTLLAGTLPNALKAENLGTAIINGGIFDVSTLGTTTAQGITNSGNTIVNGGVFNVTPKTSIAYGARCYHGLLTVNEGAEFNVTATATAYGIVAGGEQPTTAGLTYDAEAVINGGKINVTTTSAATIYGLWASGQSRKITTGTANAGNYANAGKITINDGEIRVTAKTNPAYAVVVAAVVNQAGNADYPAATATPQGIINGGKFYVTATSSTNYAVSSDALAANFQITGGYYNTHTTQTGKTYIDKYIVSPNKKLTLRQASELYEEGYRYTVGEGGTVTWKNGTTTLLTEMYESGETPAYSGSEPTKDANEEYIYTFHGWSPEIAPMETEDITYNAEFTSSLNVVGQKLDIVDWSSRSLTLNMNGYSSSLSTTERTAAYKNGWKISANGATDAEYTSSNRNADRTLTISFSADLVPNEQIVIVGKDKNDATETRQPYTVPYIITENKSLSSLTNLNENSDIYLKSGKLTVDTDATINNIIVCVGAELDIASGKTLTIQGEMRLRTTAFSSAVLRDEGTINVVKAYYSRVVSDNSQYYQLGLPFDVNVADITLTNGTAAKLNGHYSIKTYDVASRAQHGKSTDNWVLESAISTLKATAAYELLSTSKYYYEFLFPFTYQRVAEGTGTIEVQSHQSEIEADRGWNYITSPYTHIYTISGGDPAEYLKIAQLEDDNQTFRQDVLNNLQPAQPFYYQASESATLTLGSSMVSSRMPAKQRSSTVSATPTQWLRLSLLQGEDLQQAADVMNIYLSDRFGMYYEVGYDVDKLSLQGSQPLLYASMSYGDLAFAALPDEVSEAGIPLTVSLPREGQYSIALEHNDYLDRLQYVYLLDQQEGTMVDILTENYPFIANSGEIEGRFVLIPVLRSPQITTDLQPMDYPTAEQTAQPKKILVDRKLYIVMPNGKVYDAMGKMIIRN